MRWEPPSKTTPSLGSRRVLRNWRVAARQVPRRARTRSPSRCTTTASTHATRLVRGLIFTRLALSTTPSPTSTHQFGQPSLTCSWSPSSTTTCLSIMPRTLSHSWLICPQAQGLHTSEAAALATLRYCSFNHRSPEKARSRLRLARKCTRWTRVQPPPPPSHGRPWSGWFFSGPSQRATCSALFLSEFENNLGSVPEQIRSDCCKQPQEVI